MQLPNFIIIGAQKCGTTALYDTLCQHPEIYMSPVKEPFYFIHHDLPPSNDGLFQDQAHRFYYTWERYMSLFSGVTDQRAIGEASAIYLSSYQPAITAAQIQARLPTVRLIALLRQPVDRAYSAFYYAQMKGYGHAADFVTTMTAEPLHADEPLTRGQLLWRNGCYFTNLKPYFDRFPRQQIRVYLYEDWLQQPQVVLQDIFAFLEVDTMVTLPPKRSNVTYTYRYRWLHRFLNRPNRIRRALDKVLHERLRTPLYDRLRMYNRRKPPPLDPTLRRTLTERYRSDIEQLQTLIGRDLAHWINL